MLAVAVFITLLNPRSFYGISIVVNNFMTALIGLLLGWLIVKILD
jgi:hypothetical protein